MVKVEILQYNNYIIIILSKNYIIIIIHIEIEGVLMDSRRQLGDGA